LRADPHDHCPFFTGHADEVGAGPGLRCKLNLPLPPGTDGAAWLQALDAALARVAAFGAQPVRVSLGVDTFEKDPISAFKLRDSDCPQIGRRIAGLGLPTAYAFEVGYANSEVSANTASVIQGHLAAA
jgi:acetoin utilization deacetylase AcuC-like enzyme